MRFTKMHGAGNDFVMLEDYDDRMTLNQAFVAAVCDRHFGVGGDGLIRIVRSDRADFFMDYYNADGEVAEMCGNGVRCLARYVVDHGAHDGSTIRVDTRAGVKILELLPDGRFRVDMGAPILTREDIPLAGSGDPLHVRLHDLDIACVSMGNPHAIVLVEQIDDVAFDVLGPAIETDPLFPAKTNVEFTQVLNDHEVRVRVWERGVGETLACGTGACATAVATALRGLTGRQVAVHLPGGTLDISWGDDDHVSMTGPAEQVADGTLGARLVGLLPSHERVTE